MHQAKWEVEPSKEALRIMAISRAGMGKQILKAPRSKSKVQKVMHEFKTGTLKSSSGQPVTNPKQAIAIGLSEARRQRRPKRAKRSFK